jgi:hypothetical protein
MMDKKTKKQQDDQFDETLEDRLDKNTESEPQKRTKKKARRKPSTSRKAKGAQAPKDTSKKEANSQKQSDDQFVDLPEDRLSQIEKEKTQGEPEKKTRSKPSSSREAKQEQVSKDAPEKESVEPKLSKEDLLDDIRQSLAGEEDDVEAPKGFVDRLKDRLKGFSKAKKEDVVTQERSEIDFEVQDDLQDLAIEAQPKKKKTSVSKKEEDAVQEFFSDLEAMADVLPDVDDQMAAEKKEIQPDEKKPDEKIQLPKLPEKSDDKEEIDFDKVREVALQEYDETKVEPATEQKTSIQEEVRETIRESNRWERILLIGATALAAGILLFAGVFIIVKSIPTPTPEPTVAVNWEDRVHPTALNLPGGWGFPLGQGYVLDGKWSPQGAEWLIGTEISRWVALPWSLQLEAVLRTLKSEDQLELIMSNGDSLVYNVFSIQEMTMEEIQAHDTKTPSLLVILFNQEGDVDTHWVVTALP